MNIATQRESALKALTESALDVLIIGGGIVGAGIARDAALRGLKVGLVEQHDFAFGTSSRSSRLLHGGLRYLAQGRIGLVHEASVEKKIIHQIAPHLAQPLPFVFPTYRGNKHWVLWQLKIGVKIYDLLCGGPSPRRSESSAGAGAHGSRSFLGSWFSGLGHAGGRNLGQSTWLSKAEALQKVPALAETNLTGAVRYYDGFTNDARLVLDTLRSAAKSGATLVNYCRFKNATCADSDRRPLTPSLSPSEGERVAESRVTGGVRPTRSHSEEWECEVEDRLAQRNFRIRAHTVVNATGPWADGLPHSRVKLRVTKGIHLVVERARVPVPETVVMTEGKRILFAIPWGERTILGTTDTDYRGSPDQVTADTQDIAYVLQVTNRFFPGAQLTDGDVISTWAGLRPLIANPDGSPSDISRSHEIRNPEPGWWDVAGGKLTTYRLMAEQTVDQIVARLRKSHTVNGTVRGCRTAEEPLLPAAELAGFSGILPPEFSRRSVEHCVAHEWAVHLDDVMVRRTSWHYYYRDAAQKAGRAADWMGELLGWSAEQRAAELAPYRESAGSTSAPEPSTMPSAKSHDQPAHPVV